MKKLFLSLVAVIVAATATYAQNTLVATLTHGSDVTMYYGTYALRDAHNAAVSGDVINISGGSFQAVKITKGITLRGAGVNDANPTFILNSFQIDIPENDTNRFGMEGIRCNEHISINGHLSNPLFQKCIFKSITSYNETKKCMFVNCKITDYYDLTGSSSAQFVNCYVNTFGNSSSTEGATFINCIIKPKVVYYKYQGVLNRFQDMGNSQFVNCILCKDYTVGYTKLPNSSIATNCVCLNDNLSIFEDSPANSGCWFAPNYQDVFKDFDGTYTDSQSFELTDAAKIKYLGTDGTQVGMYGGILPYTSTPSYPQITKMNVANKTTADGKLSVEIEVSAAN